MKIAAASALLLLAAATAHGQTLVTPEVFEALSEGRTLHFALEGRPYGVEQYRAGRQTLWRLGDGACEIGRWYPQGDAICFTYVADPAPSCWRVLQTPEGYAAEALEGGLLLKVERIDTAPLPCAGPSVGS